MGARDLVRAIGAEHEHRQLAQRSGERREQLERGVVRPLQVVEQHTAGRSATTAASPQRIASKSVARSLSSIASPSSGSSSARCERSGPQLDSPPGTARMNPRSAAVTGS